jgi:hypothetical protein
MQQQSSKQETCSSITSALPCVSQRLCDSKTAANKQQGGFHADATCRTVCTGYVLVHEQADIMWNTATRLSALQPCMAPRDTNCALQRSCRTVLPTVCCTPPTCAVAAVATSVVGVDWAWGCCIRASHVGNSRLCDAGRYVGRCSRLGSEVVPAGLARSISAEAVAALVAWLAGAVVQGVAWGALCRAKIEGVGSAAGKFKSVSKLFTRSFVDTCMLYCCCAQCNPAASTRSNLAAAAGRQARRYKTRGAQSSPHEAASAVTL